MNFNVFDAGDSPSRRSSPPLTGSRAAPLWPARRRCHLKRVSIHLRRKERNRRPHHRCGRSTADLLCILCLAGRRREKPGLATTVYRWPRVDNITSQTTCASLPRTAPPMTRSPSCSQTIGPRGWAVRQLLTHRGLRR